MAIWLGGSDDLYGLLGAGDPETVQRFAPRFAAAAEAARKQRASAAPTAARSPATGSAIAPRPLSAPKVSLAPVSASLSARTSLSSTPPTRSAPVPASLQVVLPSRAEQVASVHLGPVNHSRKRCGLPLLTLADLTKEFADVDRTPAPAKFNRRDAGNAIAARQGVPSAQASIDAMWAGIATRRGATVAGRGLKDDREPMAVYAGSPPATRSGPRNPQSQAEIDAMHSEIADRLNATLPAQWRPKARR
jgi:hypothetical protein